ncbi:MAG TPA: ABC transporter substrate-binding protein [Stellaceae bacterium]|nr:ABC transporter substrate-binding protein [Stellaceae bacterium]
MRRLALALTVAISLATPAAAQTLVVGARSEFVIDPHLMFVGPNMAAARYVFDSLVDRDVDARPSPGLAQSWKLIDDRTWELKLRPGVTFHDGAPFTAEDVAFSIRRIPTLPNNPGPYTPNLRSITRTEVVDSLTLRFHTDSPDPVIPGQMTNIFVVSARAAAEATSADFANGKAAIGTGPFKLVKFVRGERMELERYDRFWGKPSPWQHITVRVITNDGSRIAALLAGDVDLIEDVPPEEIETLRKSGKAEVFARSSDRVMYLLPNMAEKLPLLTDADGNSLDRNPLRDPRVRHAISKAIDRKALIEHVLYGQGIAASQIVPESFGGYNPDLKVEAYDPAGARALLAEAGYPNGFGLTIGCTNDRYVNDARICQALGQMLTRAGIKAKVQTSPGAVFFPMIKNGVNPLPLVLYGSSSGSTRDATHVLSLVLHSYDPKHDFGASNRGDFRDAGLDTLIESAVFGLDASREDKLKAAMAKGIELGAAIPLYNQMTIAAARKGIAFTPRMDEQLVATYARPEK